MSYLALARKWRPQTFVQVVGQDTVKKTLINSLNTQRLHHAYLFTGTRGTGKTSIARLFAKSLNCEQGITANPCLQCDACKSIEKGCFVDLIEIDAASKTRVEDTRELLENVTYASHAGRFKIYLIDEVHMLSQHSFNALLKTLEEPPAHVKFLLATTDPQKIPVTILSRCLQLHLKPLTPELIVFQLETILAEEKRQASTDALSLIANAASGSMRDALSILDQVLVSTEQNIDGNDIKNILGYTQQDFALQLLQAIVVKKNAEEIIHIARKIQTEGGYFQYVMEELVQYLHHISLCQALRSHHPLLQSTADIHLLAEQLSPQDTQLFYQIAIKGLQDMHLAPELALGFEMCLLRMLAFYPLTANLQATTIPNHVKTATEASSLPQHNRLLRKHAEENVLRGEVERRTEEHTSLHKHSSTASTKQDATSVEFSKKSNDLSPPTPPQQPTQKSPETSPSSSDNWETVLTKLSLTGLARTAAENAVLIRITDTDIILGIDPRHQSLFTANTIQHLEKACNNYYQCTYHIILEINQDAVQDSPAQRKQVSMQQKKQRAENEFQNDPLLKQLEEKFSAEIVKNSISLHEDEL